MSENYNNAAGPQLRAAKRGPAKLIPLLAALTLGGALAASTQYFAYTFKYHSSLGGNLNGIYAPWSILSWASKWYTVYPDAFTRAGSVGVVQKADVFLDVGAGLLQHGAAGRIENDPAGDAQHHGKDDEEQQRRAERRSGKDANAAHASNIRCCAWCG